MLDPFLCLHLVFVLFSLPTLEGQAHFSVFFFNQGSDRSGIYSSFSQSALDHVGGNQTHFSSVFSSLEWGEGQCPPWVTLVTGISEESHCHSSPSMGHTQKKMGAATVIIILVARASVGHYLVLFW